MCTVSYVPLPKGQFVLTSNRDENPARSLNQITTETIHKQQVIYPQDTKGGTWICASNQNRLVCLLNGGFVKHQHSPPYPKSRGIIVKDVFSYPSILDFHKSYSLEKIEPFTMVVWENGRLFQFRRDERQSYLTPLNPREYYIWSSSTLYDNTAKRKRQSWFDNWKKQGDISPVSVLKLHKTGGDGDIKNDYVMNRNNIVKTVSITQVLLNENALSMSYNDLLRQETSKTSVILKRP